MAKERRTGVVEGELVAVGAVPVVVVDQAAGVLHAAGPEDVRAVLDLLPAAAVQGTGEIRLTLRPEEMLEWKKGPPVQLDPVTGRRTKTAKFPETNFQSKKLTRRWCGATVLTQ